MSWLQAHLVDAAFTAAASALGGAVANAGLRRRLRRLARALWILRERVHDLEREHDTTRAALVRLRPDAAPPTPTPLGNFK